MTVNSPDASSHLNPFIPSELCYLNFLDRSFSNRRGVWLVFIVTMFYRNSSVYNANSIDPDQVFNSAASAFTLFANVLFMGCEA